MGTRALVSFAAAMTLLQAACGGTGQAAHTGPGHASAGGLRLVQVGSFEQPVYVTGAPRDPSRVFVVQRTGQIELLLKGVKQSRPFLDIGGSVNSEGGEQGLLGLAFPPSYGKTGLFYVEFTTAESNLRIIQYRRSPANPNIADPGSARTVLTIDHRDFSNHNGGQLAFGPDGYLYVGVGDGGSEGDPNDNGQSTSTLLAKILRIDPSPRGGYTIPHTNPFVGKVGKREEIWAYGLRNPWRFSFDRSTGDLIVGDVGQDRYEEIDFAPSGTGRGRGVNYGWSVWEGDRRYKPGAAPHAVAPVLVFPHSEGYCAIIGGYVVRDRALPSLYGRYLIGDNCHPQIESARLGHSKARNLHPTGLQVSGTSSFGEDARAHIYITSLDGPVYRIAQG